jgi:hypothetical protein
VKLLRIRQRERVICANLLSTATIDQCSTFVEHHRFDPHAFQTRPVNGLNRSCADMGRHEGWLLQNPPKHSCGRRIEELPKSGPHTALLTLTFQLDRRRRR